MYGESLHADHRGEWTYDLAWKPLAGFPVRAGWLNADPRRPSASSAPGWTSRCRCCWPARPGASGAPSGTTSATLADAVLDVEHMVRWAPRLGRHVTLARFDGGLHDLTLSGPAVREQVFTEAGRWAEAFLAAGPTEPAPDGPPAARRPADDRTRATAEG